MTGPFRLLGEPYQPLWMYKQGGTEVAQIHADSACSIPHANPVTTDASGNLPMIFADCAIYASTIKMH